MGRWHKYAYLFILTALLFLHGCIERYHPDEEELSTGTVVVTAHLTGKPGIQTIQLSRSSTINYPEYDPLSGCYVEVVRLDGVSREFTESAPGYYSCFLDEPFLETGREFGLVMVLPDGTRYESEYESLRPAVDIDAVYWERQAKHTSDPEVVLDGIQFYIDFEMDKEAGRYLRWELEETYEIHNPEYTFYMVDLERKEKLAPDSIIFGTCWITEGIPRLYTMDLEHVEGDIYRQMPLNYVSTEFRRLYIRYSLLVRQFSLSREAFWYWDELGKNTQSKGGMFDKQPAVTPGNICNVDDGDEMVLGYFSMSGLSEKRIFVDHIPGVNLILDPAYCFPADLPVGWPMLVSYYAKSYLPVYLSLASSLLGVKYGPVNDFCVDCRKYKGSTPIKPDFW
jgi:hypothetical protein